jgi:nucleoside-diphosphate-sugar epimerase
MSLAIPDGVVLVTGATGFLGANLVRSLVADGAEVHVLVRSGARLDRLGTEPAVKVWHGDITDVAAVTACFVGARPSTVFHLAGHTAARRSPTDREQGLQALQVNLHGALHMLHAAEACGAPVQRFVRIGGLEEYGAGPTPSREDQRERPRSPYSASQVAATHWCQMMQPHLAFPVVTLRPSLVFGPGQSTDFLIPALIDSLLQGRRFATTAGAQSRDLVFVDDAVGAMRAAVSADGLRGAVINVSSGGNFIIREVVSTIADMLNARDLLDIGVAPEREGDLACLTGDPSEAERLLGWRATTSLRDGLQLTIDWHKDQLMKARGA